MSKNLNKKLLAEAFDAVISDNDVSKATRLFKRYWDICAKTNYALLESSDEEFEIADMGDTFNNEMVDEIGSDSEEKFEQAQIAVDELEDKFPEEVSDELKQKFDDVRNSIDELKLADEEEIDSVAEDAIIAVEDLKSEFEMVGELDEEVSDLFDEISSAVQGDSEESEDVADEEGLEPEESSEEDVEECGTGMLGESDEEGLEPEESSEEEVEDDLDLSVEGDDFEEEEPEESEGEESEEELMDDIKMSAEELAELIDELEAVTGDEEEKPVEESWTKVADARKKMSSEGEGVDKKNTMNFGKLGGVKLKTKAGLGAAETNSQGQEPSSKAKKCSYENKGTKSWHKVEKPSNKSSSSDSVLG